MSDLVSFSQFYGSDIVILYKRRSSGTWRRLVRCRVRRFNFTRMCEGFGTGRYLIRVVQRTNVVRLKCRITGGQVLMRRPWAVHRD